MEASKVTIGAKTYDLNHLKGKRKTDLRRKLIVEYIQSRPAGEIIGTAAFQGVGHFSTIANTHTFIKRMIRDGIIGQYDGDRPKSHYYSVIGAVRVRKPAEVQPEPSAALQPRPATTGAVIDLGLHAAITEMQKLGVKFTINISNE